MKHSKTEPAAPVQSVPCPTPQLLPVPCAIAGSHQRLHPLAGPFSLCFQVAVPPQAPAPRVKRRGLGLKAPPAPRHSHGFTVSWQVRLHQAGLESQHHPPLQRQFQLRCYSLYPKLCRAPGRARTSHSVCSKKSTKSTEITAKSRSSGKTKSRRVPSAGGGRAEQFTLF